MHLRQAALREDLAVTTQNISVTSSVMEYEVSSAAVPGSGMEQESQRVITKK